MELERIQKQILLLEKAYKTLDYAMSLDNYSQLELDWTIQRFEYTIELCWKTLKKILKYENINSNLFPREIFKEFYKIWIIKDLEKWFDFLETRNTLSHFYSEYISWKSFMFLKENYKEIWILIKNLKEKYLKNNQNI